VTVEGDIATERHLHWCANWTRIPNSWNVVNVHKWYLECHAHLAERVAHQAAAEGRRCEHCLTDEGQEHDDFCPAQGGGTQRDKEATVDGYERDWVSTRWRKVVSSLHKAGAGKYIKTKMNRRARRASNMERYDDTD
jgi:hypothetical protein